MLLVRVIGRILAGKVGGMRITCYADTLAGQNTQSSLLSSPKESCHLESLFPLKLYLDIYQSLTLTCIKSEQEP